MQISDQNIDHYVGYATSKNNDMLRSAGLWRPDRLWSEQKHYSAVRKLARAYCDCVNDGTIDMNSTYQGQFDAVCGWFWFWRFRWMSKAYLDVMIRFLHGVILGQREYNTLHSSVVKLIEKTSKLKKAVDGANESN